MSQSSFTPLYDRILVRLIQEPQGLIKVPEGSRPRPQMGNVLAVGIGRLTDDGRIIPMQIREGQTILFGKYAGSEIEIDGETLVVMKEDEVLGPIRFPN